MPATSAGMTECLAPLPFDRQRVLSSDIPGRAEGADPESMAVRVRGSGFRARRFAAPRNDVENS